MTTGKTIASTRRTSVDKVMSLVFNMITRLVITFLPRSKCLFLQSQSAVILEPPKIKLLTVSPSICHEMMGPDTMFLVFWMLHFKPIFSLSSFTFIKRLFSSYFAFCDKGGVICMSEVIDISPCPACVSSSPVFLMPSGLKFMSGGQESQITVTLFFIDMVGHIPFHTTCEMNKKKKKKLINLPAWGLSF